MAVKDPEWRMSSLPNFQSNMVDCGNTGYSAYGSKVEKDRMRGGKAWNSRKWQKKGPCSVHDGNDARTGMLLEYIKPALIGSDTVQGGVLVIKQGLDSRVMTSEKGGMLSKDYWNLKFEVIVLEKFKTHYGSGDDVIMGWVVPRDSEFSGNAKTLSLKFESQEAGTSFINWLKDGRSNPLA
eukprot:g33257.t1